jgi:transposase, IS5 family
MRPKKHETTGAGDLFRARLDQIINLKHQPVQLAGKINWEWIDGEIAPLFSDKGRPATSTRFVIELLLLKHIFALSDDQVYERWVYDPYFQYFTGVEFFQHVFPHERSDLSHWRNRLGDKLELLLAESLRIAHQTGALRTNDLARVTVDTTVQPNRRQALACGDQGAQSPGQKARRAIAAILSAHRQARRAPSAPLFSSPASLSSLGDF